MNGFSWSHFEEVPLVGILRGFNVKDCGGIVEHCGAGGLRNLEVTMNSPEAARSITMMRKATDGSMNIGAGTVCSMEDLQTALDAGARSPAPDKADAHGRGAAQHARRLFQGRCCRSKHRRKAIQSRAHRRERSRVAGRGDSQVCAAHPQPDPASLTGPLI